MPKPNHDTLQYLLEHLCRLGRLNIFFLMGRGWDMEQGLCSDGVGKHLNLKQIEETGNLYAGDVLLVIIKWGNGDQDKPRDAV